MQQPPNACLFGAPYDAHSSFLRGPAGAPAAVRRALTCGSANWCTESGYDLDPANNDRWSDLGDLNFASGDSKSDGVQAALVLIREQAAEIIAAGARPLAIGGDHLVAWPLVQAVTDVFEDLTIVHFDAHPDLYDSLGGDRFSHACPFARIMEEGKVTRLVQIGIRTMTRHQREQADRFGVDVHDFRDWDQKVPALVGPVYVSVDIDVLDPAFAPGVSHHEPGGMSTRQLLEALRQIGDGGASVVGADLVEINPARDINDMTAMVGAKLIRELLGLLLEV